MSSVKGSVAFGTQRGIDLLSSTGCCVNVGSQIDSHENCMK